MAAAAGFHSMTDKPLYLDSDVSRCVVSSTSFLRFAANLSPVYEKVFLLLLFLIFL